MSIQNEVFTTDGTFSLPALLISSNITVLANGGRGGVATGGFTPGVIVTGQILSTLLPVTVRIGHDANLAAGGDGFSAGGGGGGWRYGVNAAFSGGGGGGSTAVLDAATSAIYIEAGGGDGATAHFGSGSPSEYPGGSGGGYASNSPDNGLNVGEGAGSGGNQGGDGGNGVGGGPRDGGSGFGGPGNNGNSASGQTSGAGVGSGGLAILGAGSSFADTSNIVNTNYEIGSAAQPAQVIFSYHVADAPAAPILGTPASGAQIDANGEGVIFSGVYSAPSGDTGALSAVSLTIDNGGHWWNGTDFSSTVQIWVVPTTGSAAVSGETFTVAVPPGVIADSATYTWTMATMESYFGLESPTAVPISFQAVVPPSLVFTSPIGDQNTLTPTVSWTPTIPYSGTQHSYRALIYTTPQTIPYGTAPPAGAIYDSGVVVSASTSFSVPSATLHSIKNYFLYVQIVNSVGLVPSLWTEDDFTVELISTDTVTLSATVQSEPETGIPSVQLVMTIDASDLSNAEFQGDYGDGYADLICGLGTIADEACTVYDLGCPFNAPVSYRVRGIGTITGETYVTAWSTVVDIPLVPSIQWAIVAPTDPDVSLTLNRLSSGGGTSTDEVASPTTPAMPGSASPSIMIDEWEQQGVFRPFGKSTATIVHGDLWKPEFDLDLYFGTPDQFQRFRAVRVTQQVVLVKSDMEGQTYWVTLGPDLNPGIMSETERQRNPKRGLTVHCTPSDPYVPPNPYLPPQ